MGGIVDMVQLVSSFYRWIEENYNVKLLDEVDNSIPDMYNEVIEDLQKENKEEISLIDLVKVVIDKMDNKGWDNIKKKVNLLALFVPFVEVSGANLGKDDKIMLDALGYTNASSIAHFLLKNEDFALEDILSFIFGLWVLIGRLKEVSKEEGGEKDE